jgi:hypothetical protein
MMVDGTFPILIVMTPPRQSLHFGWSSIDRVSDVRINWNNDFYIRIDA